MDFVYHPVLWPKHSTASVSASHPDSHLPARNYNANVFFLNILTIICFFERGWWRGSLIQFLGYCIILNADFNFGSKVIQNGLGRKTRMDRLQIYSGAIYLKKKI